MLGESSGGTSFHIWMGYVLLICYKLNSVFSVTIITIQRKYEKNMYVQLKKNKKMKEILKK